MQRIDISRRRRFAEAAALFEETLRRKPEDNPSLLYLRRCRDLECAMPPEDWDGVCIMQSK